MAYLSVVDSSRQEDDSKPSENGTSSLTPSDLAGMPNDWIEQLHQAATRVNSKLILNLIEQIPLSNARLIHELTELVHDFSVEKIIALTQSKFS